jgi:hypothetical protein
VLEMEKWHLVTSLLYRARSLEALGLGTPVATQEHVAGQEAARGSSCALLRLAPGS